MSKRRDAAQILALLSWVRREMKKIEVRAKQSTEMPYVGEKLASTIKVAGPDGKETDVIVGYTQRVQNTSEFKVIDEAAFTAWVAERYPTEIVQTVRTSFLENVLKPSAFEVGALLDNDGEVCDAVEVIEGSDYLRTYLIKAADDVITPLLDSRSLTDLLKALEEDDQAEAGE